MEGKSEAGEGLWNHLVEQARADERQGNQTCGLVCGDGGSGKSSLVAGFLSSSKEEKVKPSVALEYYFARRTNITNGAKDTAHIWELAGGDGASTDLLDVPLSGKGNGYQLRRMNIIIVVDLSRPESALASLHRWLALLRARVAAALAEASPATQDALDARMVHQVPSDHPDRRSMDIFPLPLLIVGSKYDLFKDLEPVPRKTLALALRHAALAAGAGLVFASTRERAPKENFRALAGHLLFRVNLRRPTEANPERPLLVPAGADTLEDIARDLPQQGGLRAADLNAPARAKTMWEAALLDVFGPPGDDGGGGPGEAKDGGVDEGQFREALVDEMKAQKDAELAKYRRDAERKERLRRAQGKGGDGAERRSRKRSAKSSKKSASN
mmetsp:Transcript_25484/g.79804  ORF Transcript_25484/g.79804 Transcript_25484/m.79804 type:complete len:385 (-) Transcript_25484:109-1263(-)|eukprot:CAMPEP_0118854124 /NCGR_PEP_ID=MMETSP1163-20130328/2457_1 /TAXON_ID=124430 /ORGANISM="Phaeomonas parva, Strain CCMP2877" /LENGTH=384 /DNA_ID=CAMNT_0006786797 /DNA_START=162 /DNA_END=1316 /DNA_ORIENTATION=+